MSSTVPLWAWAFLAALMIVLVSIDLIMHRGEHHASRRSAVAWSLVWVGVAIAFGVFVTWQFGSERGEQYFAAYLLEKSLSVDNLFMFLVIFGALRIPTSEQRRVLTWGIVGALISRAIFIGVGAAALHRWHVVGYVFGAILIVTAVKLLKAPEENAGPPRVLGWLKRHLPWTDQLHGHHFITRVADTRPARFATLRRVGTPLLVALIAIELADIVFALDSVPAAFAVSDEPFIVYSSNVFAILGLRALYIVLASLLERLRYLRFALAAILSFAGAKLIAAQLGFHIDPLVSVGAIVGTLAIAIVLSLRAGPR